MLIAFIDKLRERFSLRYRMSTTLGPYFSGAQLQSLGKIWEKHASHGRLQRRSIVPFLKALDDEDLIRGMYPKEYRIRNLMKACRPEPGVNSSSRIVEGIDLDKLRAILSQLDPSELKKWKATYHQIYHEAHLTGGTAGISLNEMLILIADRRQALVDGPVILSRIEIIRGATDLIRLERARSVLRARYHRRKFLAYKARQRTETANPPIAPSPIAESPLRSRMAHSLKRDKELRKGSRWPSNHVIRSKRRAR
ncbi:hypothetical protein Hypma_008515 [Hypsizygus marmoreus]|uniref:Uncharacterized protein n=1 Tax=Hypsizygus marmoreus TaxID=39966 RepID=A0A369JTB9_HYPMA|nr:hypothetical protein Hypma_008515 [Hypsizygus marmoreus]